MFYKWYTVSQTQHSKEKQTKTGLRKSGNIGRASPYFDQENKRNKVVFIKKK